MAHRTKREMVRLPAARSRRASKRITVTTDRPKGFVFSHVPSLVVARKPKPRLKVYTIQAQL